MRGEARFLISQKEDNMFGGKIGIPELLVVFAIAMLIFGPSKLAGLGKGLGEGIRGFKSALDDRGSTGKKD